MDKKYGFGDLVVGLSNMGDCRFGRKYHITSITEINGETIYGLLPVDETKGTTSVFISPRYFALLKEEEKIGNDVVNHPEHYTAGGIEVIDFIEAKLNAEEQTGYFKGNIIKYVSRAGLKGNIREDLQKAQWYLNRMLGTTGEVVQEPVHDPDKAPITKKQRGYIYGLCKTLGLNPRNLPDYISEDVPETRDMTEAEGSQAIGRLLAIREYMSERSPF